jgi:hypothetical protein
MRNAISLAVCLGIWVGLSPAQVDPGAKTDTITAPCSHVIVRNWDLSLPAMQSFVLKSEVPIPNQNGNGFLIEREGMSLRVDTDGDGKTDLLVQPPESTIVLRGKSASGHPFRASVHLMEGEKGWSFRQAGILRATVDGVRIALIDQNGDGRYDGIGEDAIAIGDSKVAAFLGEVIALGDQLWRLEVDREGRHVTLTPYQGESGILDVSSDFQALAPLYAAVFRSSDGRQCFNLADAQKGMRVPVGTYTLHSGELRLGDSRVRIGRGHSRPLTVKADERTIGRFGGAPIKAEFQFRRGGGAVAFHPKAIQYFGKSGEEYLDWAPLGQSPTFIITDEATGKELARAQFPTSC